MATSNAKASSETGAEERHGDIHECDVCKLDGKKEDGKHYCQECDDYMCDSCESHHKMVKITRNHNVFSRESMPEETIKDLATAAEEELALSKEKNTKRQVFVDATVSAHLTVNVKFCYDRSKPFKYHTDQYECDCTGIVLLLNGEILIVDGQNHRLKLLDKSLNIKEVLPISGYRHGYPFDAALISDNEVIVTLPVDKVLQFVTIHPHLELGRSIRLNNQSFGVAVSQHNIYLACHEGGSRQEVIVLGKDGHVRKVIDVDKVAKGFAYPNYIAVNEQENKIYVTGYRDVLCLSDKGDVIYKTDYNVPAVANGIVLDDKTNALVCFQNKSEIMLLNHDGSEHKAILASNQGIKDPRAIAYRSSDRLLFVGGDKHNGMIVFKVN